MKFSEKDGFAPVRSVLQTNSMDDGLRNRLWNLICATYFATVPKVRYRDHLSSYPDAQATFQAIWHRHFKETTDSIESSYIDALQQLRELYFKSEWYEVYDLIQFLAEFDPVPHLRNDFVDMAYECRRLLITEEYDTHIPERKAMTRLKERIYKIYKLNYDGLKMIMENQSPNTIPVAPEVENKLRR